MLKNSSQKTLGRFCIGRTLGRGGSCKVKLGYDTENGNQRVAIKIINDDLDEDELKMIDMEI
jgi:hypothetical protein